MDIENDPEIQALKAQQRARTLRLFGIVGVVLLVVIAYPFFGIGAVRAQLEADGYSDVKVKLEGPVQYSFEGKRGTATCSGHVERMPWSTRREELCFDVK